MTTYEDFIQTKLRIHTDCGFDAQASEQLYPFQRDIVEWAARKGRAAIFADCGLGKTPMQLEWSRLIVEQTGGDVLILAPLAVASQTQREGEKFHVQVNVCKTADDIRPGVNVANYERLHHLTGHEWAAVVLDESSILKAFDGKTRRLLTDWAQRIPFRLCCTATPSPNDYEELGGHSEFLGVLNRKVMLAEFFVNDGISASNWRLKGHAGHLYWKWVAGWARALRSPADMGYDDGGFALPPLHVETIQVDADAVSDDRLFAVPVATMMERRQARRESISERVDIARLVVAEAWDKLAACGNPSTQNVAASSIKTTPPSENGGEDKDERQRRTANTCAPTTKPTQPSSSAHPSNAPSTTDSGESDTQTIPSSESESSSKLGSRRKSAGSPDGGSSSGSPESSTTPCSPHKEEDARSADRPSDSTSTTATNQGPCEESCAPNATSGSGNSKTTPASSSGLTDISTKHDPEAWVIWCDLNDEQAALEKQFGDKAISIYGTLTADEKESRMLAWLRGERPVLISKPAICAWGINMQRCSNVLFVGLSDSYEQYYQAVRRCWRFGQTHPVRVVIVASNREQAVLENVRRKETQALAMFADIVEAMNA